jgi:RNA recognition motif-containing protein
MRLFLGNLPFKASEEDLTDLFQSIGVTPDSIQVMRDRQTGQSRGFGFAEVPDEAGSQAVEAVNGRQIMGRAIVVNEARPMAERGDRPPRNRY